MSTYDDIGLQRPSNMLSNICILLHHCKQARMPAFIRYVPNANPLDAMQQPNQSRCSSSIRAHQCDLLRLLLLSNSRSHALTSLPIQRACLNLSNEFVLGHQLLLPRMKPSVISIMLGLVSVDLWRSRRDKCSSPNSSWCRWTS